MNCKLNFGLCFTLYLLLACTKSDTGNSPGNSRHLSPIAVKVLERTPVSALIKWDSSVNKLNNERCKYKVILDNKVVADSLTILSYRLLNLEKNKAYKGQVAAYISTGDVTVAYFSLSTYDGAFYAYISNTFTDSWVGAFHTYPVTFTGTQPYLWRINCATTLTPTVSNDTLFLVTDGNLYAVNATSGATIWQAAVKTDLRMSVTYSEGRLYACQNTGELACFNAANGQLLWSYRHPSLSNYFNVPPVIDNNRVFVTNAGYSSGELHAVDAVTGKKLWSYNYPYLNTVGRRLLITNGVVVATASRRILAINQNTGKFMWERTDFESAVNATATDGRIVVHAAYSLNAFDPQNGRQLWTFDTNGDLFSDCIAGNGMIYLSKDSARFSPATTHLKCIDAKDGHLVWAGIGGKNLVLAKDRIYFWNPQRVLAYTAATGDLDLSFVNYNPVYNGVQNFCIKRDGVMYYPSSHGNHR